MKARERGERERIETERERETDRQTERGNQGISLPNRAGI